MSDSAEYGDAGSGGGPGVGPGEPASGPGDPAGGGTGPGSPDQVPFGQRLYDNAFFWLVAGIAVMAVVYTGWGLVEILSLPQAPLP